MADPKKYIIDASNVDVGVVEEFPGRVTSEFCVSDDQSFVIALPAATALQYGLELARWANEVLSGSVRMSSREQKIGVSLTVDRSRTERLDS